MTVINIVEQLERELKVPVGYTESTQNVRISKLMEMSRKLSPQPFTDSTRDGNKENPIPIELNYKDHGNYEH